MWSAQAWVRTLPARLVVCRRLFSSSLLITSPDSWVSMFGWPGQRAPTPAPASAPAAGVASESRLLQLQASAQLEGAAPSLRDCAEQIWCARGGSGLGRGSSPGATLLLHGIHSRLLSRLTLPPTHPPTQRYSAAAGPAAKLLRSPQKRAVAALLADLARLAGEMKRLRPAELLDAVLEAGGFYAKAR